MARIPVKFISNLQEWSVLLQPVRFELIEAMRSVAPCSIAELGAMLVRPADALYRHIELLQASGFVVSAGFRKSGRHIEQLYDLTASDFLLDRTLDPKGQGVMRAVVDLAKTAFSSAETILEESADAGALRFDEREQNFAMFYELAWLSEKDFADVFRLTEEIKSIIKRQVGRSRMAAEGKTASADKFYAVLSIAMPITRHARTRKSGSRDPVSSQPSARMAEATDDSPPMESP